MAPPLYSTLSAVSELAVTAVVAWFFYHALRHDTYKWGIMLAALVYEVFFNVTYMVARLGSHVGADPDRVLEPWYIAFVGFHGILSLVMLLGLIAYMFWAFGRYLDKEPNPIASKPRLATTFLVMWGISILSGEIIYVFQWTGTGVV